jgi:hypothetical protein
MFIDRPDQRLDLQAGEWWAWHEALDRWVLTEVIEWHLSLLALFDGSGWQTKKVDTAAGLQLQFIVNAYSQGAAMEAKLTIKLPEDLRRATARAVSEGTTLSEVIRQRLEEFAAGWDALEEADDVRAFKEIEDRIARGKERLKDWAKVDAGLAALQDQSERSHGTRDVNRRAAGRV